MTRGRKRKKQKGGIIRPSSIVPFLGSSTMMPGAYLNMWKKKKKKKKKTQKGRGLPIGQIQGKMGPILGAVGPAYKIGKFYGQKLINNNKKKNIRRRRRRIL